MHVQMRELLQEASAQKYAIGAFNVYNLEGVRAVIAAAEAERSPVILQLHPAPLRFGGSPLVALCLAAARDATIPVAVHLDHSTAREDIRDALYAGIGSVMADGSALPYGENIAFTREMADLAHGYAASIEAELGRLGGTEDGLTVSEREARMTDPEQAAAFVATTGIDALAVCIGNVHGNYRGEPRLDFERLSSIRERVSVPLVLHGASGLPEEMVRRSIELGVAKFNVNTEVRKAYISTLKEQLNGGSTLDLLDLMTSTVSAMQVVVRDKLRLFGSSGRVA